MIRLYWLPASCAVVPLIALEEIGVPFELTLINKFAGEHARAPYIDLNPKGRVPTLVADELILTENPAIQLHLAQMFPESKLLPTASLDHQSRALATLCWISSTLHPAITRLRHPESASPDPATFDGLRRGAARLLSESFAIAEDALGDREWLFGSWTIADAYLSWAWWRAGLSGLDQSPFPVLAAHSRRADERPSAARALSRQAAEIAGREDDGSFPKGALLAQLSVVDLS